MGHIPVGGQQASEVMTEGVASTIQWVFIVVGALALIYLIYKWCTRKKPKPKKKRKK